MLIRLNKLLTLTQNRINEPVFIDSNESRITWPTFLTDIQQLSSKIALTSYQQWALCYQDTYAFAVAFFAVLVSEKTPLLLPNYQIGTLNELDAQYDALLTDLPSLHAYATPLPSTAPASNNLNIHDNQYINLFTSGSSGTPKKVSRSIQHLMNEIDVLEQSFGAQLQHATIYASVSCQHIYGLLFYLLWPLCALRSIYHTPLQYPEQIVARIWRHQILQTPLVLITSPALLKRFSIEPIDTRLTTIFSSGGLLSYANAQSIHQCLNQRPIEILGSTETGGVAYRQQTHEQTSWTPLPNVQIRIDPTNQTLIVTSPFFEAGDGLAMGDKASINPDGSFQLLGRADRIAKIEEKRVSLTAIENKLLQHDWVANAAALAMEDSRQYVAVVISLTAEGETHLARKGKLHLNNTFKTLLAQSFEPILIPKRFRYIDEIPSNAQGKYILSVLENLFKTV